MDELIQFLTNLLGDDSELVARIGDADPMDASDIEHEGLSDDERTAMAAWGNVSDDDLAATRDALSVAAHDPDTASETVLAMTEAVTQLDFIRDVRTEVAAAAETQRTEALAAMDANAPAEPDPNEGDSGGGDDSDPPASAPAGDGDDSDPTHDELAALGAATEADLAALAALTEDELAAIAATESDTEPVTAASARPALGRVQAPSSQARRPDVAVHEPDAGPRWRAAREAGGRRLGEDMDLQEVAEYIAEIAPDFQGDTTASGEFQRLATLRYDYPESRTLTDDPVENASKVQALVDQSFEGITPASTPQERIDALTASGGICAPPQPYYPVAQLGDADRPIRSFLPSFQATRGGITAVPPPSLPDGDFNAGVTVWTEPIDAAPVGATKNCVVLTCDAAVDTTIEAIWQCVEWGNLGGRTYPEMSTAWLRGTNIRHARVAETRILTAIDAAGVAVTDDQNLGFARDFVNSVARARAGVIDRHRLPSGFIMDVIAPSWVPLAMQADLNAQIPGDNAFGISEATVRATLATLGVRIGFSRDNDVELIGGGLPQAAAPLHEWPNDCVYRMFPPGSFLHLDAGLLNFGMVRDSTLNSTNDVQTQSETFEAVAFVGVESMTVTISDICISGATAGTVTPVCTGS